MKKYCLKASYTVEAAYIVPLIMFVLLTIISVNFHLHDVMVSDVWAAHLAEEARMAVSYRRIPFQTVLYFEGFDNADDYEIVEQLIGQNGSGFQQNILRAETDIDEVEVNKEEVFAEIKCYSDTLKLPYGTEKVWGGYISQKRLIYEPEKCARLTSTVYRLGKQVLN